MASHVLVVDDTEDIRRLVIARLELAGFATSEAADGSTALERAAAMSPDVILLDWVMPGLDGIEVCRRLKSDPATAAIPVYLLTGRTLPEEEQAALAAGAVGLISKPFEFDDLIRRLNEAISGSAGGPA
jgi:CheY-like chemotaxis protein